MQNGVSYAATRDKALLPRLGIVRPFAAVMLGWLVGGCAISMPIASFSSKSDDDVTGSISKPVSPLSRKLDAEDWRRAQAAMATALDPQGNGTAVNWDNPTSGARGNFVPVASAFPRDDGVCRAFVARVGTAETQDELQGIACRKHNGDWVLNDIRPWKKS